MTSAEPPRAEGSGERDPGARLSALEPRLRLLLVHLSGRALRARVELDDLAQEVWLRVLASPSELPPFEAGDVRLWGLVRRVARHAVIDAARALRTAKRGARVQRLAHSDWSRFGDSAARASRVPGRGPGPATLAAAGETERRILAAFETLSPEHRRVIGLRQLEALSAREAARRLGRGESAVHSLYRRALGAWEQAIEAGKRDESGAGRRLGSP